MNLTIESLNLWGARALEFAWPVLWQSSLLIGLLFALDFALRRRVRAAVRYALWLVVLLKLVLPPALALPTSLSWWLRPAKPAPVAPPPMTFSVTYGPSVAPPMPEPTLALPVAAAPARPALTLAAWALLLSSGVSLGLLSWMLLRWRQVARDVRQAEAAPQPLQEMLEAARGCSGLRRPVRLGLTERPMSPAVCGLFRPTILLPRSLAERLAPAQLRAVLLHELAHLRRGDVWVNCAQALLQVAYWWHPLLWLANARIRQTREEAVDDAVMAALREEAEAYAPTLLEVARLALQRPLTSLGLVGILESRSSLRQRIQRLLEFHPPRKAGLTLASAFVVLAFAALAVPMGEAPAPTAPKAPAGMTAPTHPLVSMADAASPQINIKAKFIEVPEAEVAAIHARFAGTNAPGSATWGTMLSPEQLREQFHRLEGTDGAEVLAAPEVTTVCGRQCQMMSTDGTNIVFFDRSSVERITGTESTFSILPQTNATPQTNQIEVGNILDAFPLLEADGYTVRLKAIITAIEFLGYTNLPDGGSPLPQFRSRDFGSLASVPDGQTLVLDSPAMAKTTSGRKHHVLVFITPTLIDSAGNKLHKDEDLRAIRQSKLSLEALPADFPSTPLLPKGLPLALATALNRPAAAPLIDSPGNGPSTNPAAVDPKSSAAALVHNGMVLYQMAKLDEASAKFNQALALNPQNQLAQYWTNQVAQVRSGKATIHTNENRQTILKKLNTIKLDEVRFDGLPLSQVIINLNDQVRKHDPEKRGLNFIINPNGEVGTAASPGAIDPTTGLPVAPTAAAADQRVNISTALVKLSPPLTKVTIQEALDAIVKVANMPIKYSVADYAVVFSPRLETAPKLATRKFKIDFKRLPASLSGTGGLTTNAAPWIVVSDEFKNLFQSLGVELKAPKTIFFNEREGSLYVRATPEELDTIEQALHTPMQAVVPQIHLACKFVEITQHDPQPYGFDWYLGNVMLTNASNSVSSAILAPASSQGLRSGLTLAGNAGFTLTGVLTDPQYRVVLHALDQRESADVLAAPQVVTLSGRQVQCKVGQAQTILKGIKPQARTSPGIPKGEEGSWFEVEQREFGPMLDVTPVLLADDYTVNLTVLASVMEFLGYEQPTNRVTVYVGGKPMQVWPPQPKFHAAQVVSTVNVWDGQTVVLGGLMSERVLTQKDSVPVLGSLPLAGALFRKESHTTQKRNLMVFITPTLVDAAGNKVHSEDEMPFARNAIPVQPKR